MPQRVFFYGFFILVLWDDGRLFNSQIVIPVVQNVRYTVFYGNISNSNRIYIYNIHVKMRNNTMPVVSLALN